MQDDDSQPPPSKSLRRRNTPSKKTTNHKLATETSRRTVLVVAPKTLPQDYEFDVLIDDQTYTITVPKGGVSEGQEFEVPHPEDVDAFDEYDKDDAHNKNKNNRGRQRQGKDKEDTNKSSDDHEEEEDDDDSVALTAKPTDEEEDDLASHIIVKSVEEGDEEADTLTHKEDDGGNDSRPRQSKESRDGLGAPYGRWRYPLCACCDVVTQATFWMALCCVPVLIAQLVTRMKLNWRGKKDSNPVEVSLSYNKILLTFLVVLSVSSITGMVGWVIVLIFVVTLLVYTGRNLRKTIRQRYNIPPSLPCAANLLDDCCCMLFCCCCTSIQMSRQTHNDKEYPGSCCTPTGLDMDAPEMTV
ncbi:hypothetical protein ACA910_018856 [Epithemia clementina (nom. ined.)]